ncbi:hypothetical protein CUMW_275320 [Citrus unshiu]|uniref:Fucosyltransferase n=1 Tax=Citrus unshiu TaxID=55188 RepID=A0A2H5N0C6_CITUN|nr:hypothetical protein CUMW_275320 [Citrus unshiu]
MKRVNKSPDSDLGTQSDPDNGSNYDNVLRDPVAQYGFEFNSMRMMGLAVVTLMLVSVLFSVSVVLRDPPDDGVWEANEAKSFEVKSRKEEDSFQSAEVPKELLGGLLSAEFDKKSCLSRYQSAFYRKELSRKPSSYLISRLRSYEALHQRCGPYTKSYNKTLQKLKSGNQPESSDCNYLVWISFSGLGNRILTLASAFLYALLTNRVLLVDPGVDMVDLFCEPFPEVSWFLPSDFPLKNQFDSFDQISPHCYGRLLKNNNTMNSNGSSRSFVYLHLVHDYDDHDKLFFCDEDQSFLQKYNR